MEDSDEVVRSKLAAQYISDALQNNKAQTETPGFDYFRTLVDDVEFVKACGKLP